MDETEFNELTNSSITKTHEEILKMLEEIKEFEKKYGVSESVESILEKELPDFEYVKFEEIEPDMVYFKEVEKKPNIFEKIKKFKIDFKFLRKKELKIGFQSPKNPTTFRLRLNKEGILENIDIKKPQPKKKIKFSFRKKEKKEIENLEGKSRFLKIKNGLSKIRRIIPRRGKNEENELSEPESEKESE